ncbi:MAG: hypothetical protein ACRDWY_17565 [Actinomycetes bacterium]
MRLIVTAVTASLLLTSLLLPSVGPPAYAAPAPIFPPGDRSELLKPVALETPAELPGGGKVLFPRRRLVALYGHPGAPSLGVLGEQGVSASVARARRVARPYRRLSTVPVVPAFELIATVAQRSPGTDGDYSGEASVRELLPWVRAAARNGMYVVLDLQPGRAHALEQAKRYRRLLLQPHVGLAVDPEWKLAPGQKPLEQIGHIDATELNAVSGWLAGLARDHDLPQKLFVVHQFRLSMVRRMHRLRTERPEVAVLVHMDGQGSAGQKRATWSAVKAARPAGVPLGWKNFYDEDHPTFTPERTMARRPRPRMVSYQ